MRVAVGKLVGDAVGNLVRVADGKLVAVAAGKLVGVGDCVLRPSPCWRGVALGVAVLGASVGVKVCVKVGVSAAVGTLVFVTGDFAGKVGGRNVETGVGCAAHAADNPNRRNTLIIVFAFTQETTLKIE